VARYDTVKMLVPPARGCEFQIIAPGTLFAEAIYCSKLLLDRNAADGRAGTEHRFLLGLAQKGVPATFEEVPLGESPVPNVPSGTEKKAARRVGSTGFRNLQGESGIDSPSDPRLACSFCCIVFEQLY
jgi:hypothetical protein